MSINQLFNGTLFNASGGESEVPDLYGLNDLINATPINGVPSSKLLPWSHVQSEIDVPVFLPVTSEVTVDSRLSVTSEIEALYRLRFRIYAEVEGWFGYNVSREAISYYSLRDRIFEEISSVYDLDTYNPVDVEIIVPTKLAITSETVSDYSAHGIINVEISSIYDLDTYNLVDVEIEVPSKLTVAGEVTGIYSLMDLLGAEITSIYDLDTYNPVDVEIETPSKLSLTTEVTGIYSLQDRVAEEITGGYHILDTILVDSEIVVPSRLAVTSEVISNYPIRSIIDVEVEVDYGLRVHAKTEVSGVYDLLTYNPVNREIYSYWSLDSFNAVVINDQPVIYFDGEYIDIVACDISTDEESYIWQGTITLADIEDYYKFNQDDELELILYSDSYTFIVDSKNRHRAGPVSIDLSLSVVSPGAKHDFPRAEPFTKTWTIDTLAKDIVEEVLGESITWDYNFVNWYIPAYRLSVESVAPISVVQDIVKAAGGVIESNIDGSLYVRHLYPVSVQYYDVTAADHQLDGIPDIFVLDETFNAGDLVNRLRILDVEATYKDTIEVIEDENNWMHKTLHAFPSPWRTEVNVYSTTSSIVLTPVGQQTIVVNEECENGELIEIFAGEGSTRYPIWGIESVEWLSTSLGGLTFEAGGSNIYATAGTDSYGLVRLKYLTKYYQYETYAPASMSAQYLMEDTSEV